MRFAKIRGRVCNTKTVLPVQAAERILRISECAKKIRIFPSAIVAVEHTRGKSIILCGFGGADGAEPFAVLYFKLRDADVAKYISGGKFIADFIDRNAGTIPGRKRIKI